ncbi:MAG: DUF2797 domain-containing protein [Arenicella sp.]
MQASGQVRKLISHINPDTKLVDYSLPIGDQKIGLNNEIGKHIHIRFEGNIHCINCNRKTKKSFAQGHCFPCMRSLASCDTCIVKPELCHFHAGTCREPDWGEANCFADHYVYLSNTSGLKIGITRGNQIPTRWVDQGAVTAMPIYRAANRRISGLLEHPASNLIADKTNWRTMLKGNIPEVDLLSRWQELKPALEEIAQPIRAEHGENALIETHHDITSIDYPVIEYPSKVASHNLDKAGQAAGKLMGIKGQYLILDTGVLNIRKYTGYELHITSSD